MFDRWTEAMHRTESKCKCLVKIIAADIETGALPLGTRLPPQRQVAADLRVSVQTVNNAYKELERHGLINCDGRRGSFVCGRITETVSNFMLDKDEHSLADFSIARIVHTPAHLAAWQDACKTLSQMPEQPWITTCRPIAGLDHHRRAGADWLQTLGMPVGPDNLLITNGAAHGIFLALASLAGPGDTVLCENLTDHGVIGAASVIGFTLKGLDIDEYGIQPDHFEELCDSERISALVCTPTFNNPTAALMPESRRRAIARIAERYGVYVIEDAVYDPLLEKPLPPISSMIPELAFYCTSMTKSVLAGLRIGYLAMPSRLALRTESILRVNSWMATPPMAEIAAQWIENGTVQALLAEQRKQLSWRQAQVKNNLGPYLRGHHPHALFSWVAAPEHWPLDELAAALRRQHIAVTLPDPFMARGASREHAIRLCVGNDQDNRAFAAAVAEMRDLFKKAI